MTTVERKMLLVDVRDVKKSSSKVCSTCGVAESSAPVTTPTDRDYAARAESERLKLERDGWALDLTHKDTKRFHNTIEGHVSVADLTFAVALSRAKV